MTEDYKDLLFNYFITGITSGTASSTDEVILQKKNISLDLMSHLTNATDFSVNGIIEGSDNFVMYGGYNTNNDSWLGFIALLDTDFNLVEVITQFSSGTPLRTICALEVAEDNTFYGVDYQGSYTSRFIMLNNFTIPNSLGNYIVKLRTSYNFNDNDFLAQIGIKIFKNPNSSHYVFIGETESDFTLKIIELKIVVGASNEWTSYNSPNYEFYMNGYVDFDSSDNAYISTIGINSSNQIRLVYKNYTATALNSTLIETATGDPYMYGNSPVAFIGKDKFYYIWTDDNTKNTYLNYYDSAVSSIQTLNNVYMYLTSKNGELYIGFDYATLGSNTAKQFYYQRYTNTWSPIGIKGYHSYMQNGYMFVVNNYNLLNIFVFDNLNASQLEGELLTEDYNKSNYNSYPYIDPNVIFPQKVRLYSSGNLVFARNDYNISCLGNTFTTTVEVPNVYLNNGTISPSQLVSKDNQILISDTTPITKNIYEKTYINFINSITSYDEDTGRTYDTTSLVKNISGLGYSVSDSRISKLLYLDNTEQIINQKSTAYWYAYTGRLTGRWRISFTKTSNLYKLAFANNQDQIYAWVDVSHLANGTYYLTQYVRLADIPLGDQNIVYNNNTIQYNGNDVIYYTSI